MRPEAESIIDEITELLHRLSSAERRVLQRRLRVSGLIETEELVADRNRLEVATALGVQVAESVAESIEETPPKKDRPEKDESAIHESARFESTQLESAPEAPPRSDSSHETDARIEPNTFTESADSSTHETSQFNPPEHRAYSDEVIGSETNSDVEYVDENDLDEQTEYHSAVSGKVVVGVPDNSDMANRPPDPHMMSPLPGQAPEHPIRVVFDGGSKGNPGVGYGSYALDWPGLPQQIVQLQFGNRVTNNEAEYDTLIAALEGIIDRLEDQDAELATAQLDIRGDSQLVIKQVHGEYKCKNSRMRVRCDRVRELLAEFDDWSLTHHGREHSVRILGH